MAHVAIPAPSDGLASTYGVVAASGPSTASAQPRRAERAHRARGRAGARPRSIASDPATIDVRGFDALDGSPAAGLSVHVTVSHGPTIQDQTVTLGRRRDGSRDVSRRRARHEPRVGASRRRRAATPLDVVGDHRRAERAHRRARAQQSRRRQDRDRSARGRSRATRTGISASLAGAVGDALITMESVRGVTPAVVPVQNGAASTSLAVPETIGALHGRRRVRPRRCARRRDRNRWSSTARVISARSRSAPTVRPTRRRDSARITIADGDDRSDATLAVRVSDRRAAGGASFDDIPGVLASAGTTTQNLASQRSALAHLGRAGASRRPATSSASIGRAERPRPKADRAEPRARVHVAASTAATARTFDVPVPHDPRPLRALDRQDDRRRRRRRRVDRADRAMSARSVPPPQSARLMLLDTYGLVYRAFFALPALTTTHGVPINAAYGFTMMLTKLIADEKPTHVDRRLRQGPAGGARRDLSRSTRRTATRCPTTCAASSRSCARSSRPTAIPIVEIEGEEADDVIATLGAHRGRGRSSATIVVTGDLDLLQIVDDATTVLTTRRGITDLGRYDAAAVRERFELEPRQLPDYRGLKGDPSDNLPGIPGVGEKTAIKLIKAAGSLDALLANPTLAGTPKLEAAGARARRDGARLPRRLDHQARSAARRSTGTTRGSRSPRNDALYAPLSRARVQVAAREARRRRRTRSPSRPTRLLHGTYVSYVAGDRSARLRAARRACCARRRRAPRVALALRGDAIGVSAADEHGLRVRPRRADEPGDRRGVRRAVDARAAPRRATMRRRSIGALGLPPRADRRRPDDRRAPARPGAHVRRHRASGVGRACTARCPRTPAAAADAASRLARVAARRARARDQLALYTDVELPLVVGAGEDRTRRRRARPRGAGRSARARRRRRRAAAARDLRRRRRDVQHRLAAAARPRPLRQARTAARRQEPRPATPPASKCCKASRAASRSRRRCSSTARSRSSRTPTSTCCRR